MKILKATCSSCGKQSIPYKEGESLSARKLAERLLGDCCCGASWINGNVEISDIDICFIVVFNCTYGENRDKKLIYLQADDRHRFEELEPNLDPRVKKHRTIDEADEFAKSWNGWIGLAQIVSKEILAIAVDSEEYLILGN